MASQIRPNRLEVSDRFPMLGFTIKTDADDKSYEVVIASDVGLFKPDAKTKRTRSNFYSSRVAGLLPVERGEAVYVLPPEILARFVGQEKLYYALATYSNGKTTTPEISTMPSEGSAYVNLKGLSGRSLRRVRILPSRQRAAAGYGNGGGGDLEWAGDAAMLGTHPAAPAQSRSTPATTLPAAPASSTGPTNGKGNGASTARVTAGTAQAAALLYNDGWGPLPVVRP